MNGLKTLLGYEDIQLFILSKSEKEMYRYGFDPK